MKEFLLKTFLNNTKNIKVSKAKGIKIYSTNKKVYTDFTGGLTGHAILGWGNKKIIDKIKQQINKFHHVDYKVFDDPNREKLARKLLLNSKSGLDKLFLVGSSGAEACDAAMKLSYQYFYNLGKKNKRIFISRKQSYHGCTSAPLSVSDRPNLHFFKPILNRNIKQISEHNYFRHGKKNESSEEYSNRCAKELEEQILTTGPEKICAFIAETFIGGLVGNCDNSKNYWKKISRICRKYNIHIILDEVYCGTGTTGKTFAHDWENIKPDFVFLSKTLAAGYGALSAVVTRKKIINVIKKGQGQIQYSNTHQGHSTSVAAALEVQNIINNSGFLNSVIKKGNFIRETLKSELYKNDFYLNVRGQGMRNSLEYKCSNQNLFGAHIKQRLLYNYRYIVDAKFHRIHLPLSLNVEQKQLEKGLEVIIETFKYTQKNWNSLKKKNIKVYNF